MFLEQDQGHYLQFLGDSDRTNDVVHSVERLADDPGLAKKRRHVEVSDMYACNRGERNKPVGSCLQSVTFLMNAKDIGKIVNGSR